MSYLKHKPGSIEELMSNEASRLNDNAYQDMFKKELDKAGKGIGSMSPKEKKDFFNKIDDKYQAKNELKEPIQVKEDVSVWEQAADDKEKLAKEAKYLKVEDKDVPAGSHKMPDGTIMKDKDHKKEVKEEDAYENDRYIIKNGKATLDNSNTPDKKNHVYADGHKDAEKKAKAKGIKEESDNVKAKDLDKFHKKLDNLVHKSLGKSSDEKKETHTFMTKDMNQKQKDAKGEKEVPTVPKTESMIDAVKSVWQLSAEELEKIKDEAKYMKAERMDKYKAEKHDDKNKKGTADTGTPKTKVDVEPEVDYRN